MTADTKMRDEYNQWCLENGYSRDGHPKADGRWQGWQAAYQAGQPVQFTQMNLNAGIVGLDCRAAFEKRYCDYYLKRLENGEYTSEETRKMWNCWWGSWDAATSVKYEKKEQPVQVSKIEKGVVQHLVKSRIPKLINRLYELKATQEYDSDVLEYNDFHEVMDTLEECLKQLAAITKERGKGG